jgi:hypothetical protein
MTNQGQYSKIRFRSIDYEMIKPIFMFMFMFISHLLLIFMLIFIN